MSQTPSGQKSTRLFENEFLEKMTHVHPILPLVIWVPVIFTFLYMAIVTDGYSAKELIKFSVLGFLTWTFTEYVLHRFAFHYEGNNAFTKRIHFLIHGIHHLEPNDKTRLVMPPIAGVLIATALYWVFRLFINSHDINPFFAFFLLGYLCYDYTHYAIHHFKMNSGWARRVKQNHMTHHFVDSTAWIGVSSPLWDYVFRTTK